MSSHEVMGLKDRNSGVALLLSKVARYLAGIIPTVFRPTLHKIRGSSPDIFLEKKNSHQAFVQRLSDLVAVPRLFPGSIDAPPIRSVA